MRGILLVKKPAAAIVPQPAGTAVGGGELSDKGS
jgi:hypothetical protein